jgi:class 3 adenylate cyclase
MASRLESHGAVGTLNVSAGIRQRLGNTYLIEPGGRVDLKGKGPTDVYHLRGRR